ncbi:hypothetical protein CYMTET_32359, partial [Cymbomonas tetramitiformis]
APSAALSLLPALQDAAHGVMGCREHLQQGLKALQTLVLAQHEACARGEPGGPAAEAHMQQLSRDVEQSLAHACLSLHDSPSVRIEYSLGTPSPLNVLPEMEPPPAFGSPPAPPPLALDTEVVGAEAPALTESSCEPLVKLEVMVLEGEAGLPIVGLLPMLSAIDSAAVDELVDDIDLMVHLDKEELDQVRPSIEAFPEVLPVWLAVVDALRCANDQEHVEEQQGEEDEEDEEEIDCTPREEEGKAEQHGAVEMKAEPETREAEREAKAASTTPESGRAEDHGKTAEDSSSRLPSDPSTSSIGSTPQARLTPEKTHTEKKKPKRERNRKPLDQAKIDALAAEIAQAMSDLKDAPERHSESSTRLIKESMAWKQGMLPVWEAVTRCLRELRHDLLLAAASMPAEEAMPVDPPAPGRRRELTPPEMPVLPEVDEEELALPVMLTEVQFQPRLPAMSPGTRLGKERTLQVEALVQHWVKLSGAPLSMKAQVAAAYVGTLHQLVNDNTQKLHQLQKRLAIMARSTMNHENKGRTSGDSPASSLSLLHLSRDLDIYGQNNDDLSLEALRMMDVLAAEMQQMLALASGASMVAGNRLELTFMPALFSSLYSLNAAVRPSDVVSSAQCALAYLKRRYGIEGALLHLVDNVDTKHGRSPSP